jgi:hypothetical protein
VVLAPAPPLVDVIGSKLLAAVVVASFAASETVLEAGVMPSVRCIERSSCEVAVVSELVAFTLSLVEEALELLEEFEEDDESEVVSVVVAAAALASALVVFVSGVEAVLTVASVAGAVSLVFAEDDVSAGVEVSVEAD